MVFTMRQLVEKSWEHSAKLFVTFIDLQKAYDSVPRNAMWMALRKLGVPDSMHSKSYWVISSGHDSKH